MDYISHPNLHTILLLKFGNYNKSVLVITINLGLLIIIKGQQDNYKKKSVYDTFQFMFLS